MNRENGPAKHMIPKLKKGDTRVILLTNGKLNLIKFMDRKVQTGKVNPVTKEPIVKFHAVHEYNQYMGAVDRSDEMVSYNAFKRRTLKWWKKAVPIRFIKLLFYHFLWKKHFVIQFFMRMILNEN